MSYLTSFVGLLRMFQKNTNLDNPKCAEPVFFSIPQPNSSSAITQKKEPTQLYQITTIRKLEDAGFKDLVSFYSGNPNPDQNEYCNDVFYAVRQAVLAMQFILTLDVKFEHFEQILNNICSSRRAMAKNMDPRTYLPFGMKRTENIKTPFREGNHYGYYFEEAISMLKSSGFINLVQSKEANSILKSFGLNNQYSEHEAQNNSTSESYYFINPFEDIESTVPEEILIDKDKISKINRDCKEHVSLKGDDTLICPSFLIKKSVTANATSSLKNQITFLHMNHVLIDDCLKISYIYFKKIMVILKSNPMKSVNEKPEVFQAFLRCIYYANVATPYMRGSSEIINIFHLALRELIGFKTKDIYVLQELDVIALLSRNFGEFSKKYNERLHPKLQNQGSFINWTQFETAYKYHRQFKLAPHKPLEGMLFSLAQQGSWNFVKDIIQNSERLSDSIKDYEDIAMDFETDISSTRSDINSPIPFLTETEIKDHIVNSRPQTVIYSRPPYAPAFTAVSENKNDNLIPLKLTDYTGGGDSTTTLFHLATQAGESEIVRLLMQKAPGLKKRINEKQETPLYLAAEQENWEIIKILIENIKFDLTYIKPHNQFKTTVLHLAAEKNQPAFIDFLTQKAKRDTLALIEKSSFENIKILYIHSNPNIYLAEFLSFRDSNGKLPSDYCSADSAVMNKLREIQTNASREKPEPIAPRDITAWISQIEPETSCSAKKIK